MKKSLFVLFLCLMVAGCESSPVSNPGAQPSPAPQGGQEKPGKSADVQSANNVQNPASGAAGNNQGAGNTGSTGTNGDGGNGQQPDQGQTRNFTANEIMKTNRLSVSSTHALTQLNGVVYSWGKEGSWLGQTATGERKGFGAQEVMNGGVSFRFISAGEKYTARITEDGLLDIFGNQASWLLGNDWIKDVASVALGPNYVALVTLEGELYTWGNGKDGKLGQYLGTWSDSLWKWVGKESDFSQSQKRAVPFFKDIAIASVAVGVNHTAAVSVDGRLFTWGNGLSGKLGHGDFAMKPTPTEVNFFNKENEKINIVSVTLGPNSSAAVTSTGALYMWGDCFEGLELVGSKSDSYKLNTVVRETPKQVVITNPNNPSELVKVASVAISEKHVAVLTQDGMVYTWGDNSKGQLGRSGTDWEPLPAGEINKLGKAVAIAVGPRSTIVLREKGTYDEFGESIEQK